MAAAYSETAVTVEDILRNIVAQKRIEGKKENIVKPVSYRLQFTFDDIPFTTIFEIKNKKRFGTVITNKCIELLYLDELESSISANNPEKGCFTPPLYDPKNLPPGVTSTDILQTLSTKLKFTILRGKDTFTIQDVARLTNKVTGRLFHTQLSLWRLLRGEQTLYEKYGYVDSDIDTYRTVITALPWVAVMDYKTPKGMDPNLGLPSVGNVTLGRIAEVTYPGIFQPDQSIAENMRKLSLVDVDKYFENIGTTRKTFVHLVMNALSKLHEIDPPHLYLKITRDSPIWKAWDTRLQFVSFEPVAMGGGRSSDRRSDRRSKHYRTRKHRK